MSNAQRGYGPGLDLDDASPVVPTRRMQPPEEVKKDSTQKSSKKHHHKEHRHSSHKQQSHQDSSDYHRKHKSHKSSTSNPEVASEGMYAPDSRPSSNKPRQEASSSTKKHHQSLPKNKMQKLQDNKPHRRSTEQGDPEFVPHQKATRNKDSIKKKSVSQSAPPVRTRVPIVNPPEITSTRREQSAPNTYEDAMVPYGETPRAANGRVERSYPGAYWEERSGLGSSEEEDSSLSDMENGEGLITAYVVPNEASYHAPTQDTAPHELLTRSAPPHQTVEAPRQVNETKQSLNITVPQGVSAGAPVVSSVHQSGGNNGCFICLAVGFALVGTGCVVLFFVIPILGIWLLIPGIVFLIVSCVACCCICSRSRTNVTTIVTQ